MEDMTALGTSIWQTKPWWCQPWSIVLTGAAVVLASWFVLHRWWVTLPVAIGVGLWWAVFLLLVPAAYQQSQQQNSAAGSEQG